MEAGSVTMWFSVGVDEGLTSRLAMRETPQCERGGEEEEEDARLRGERRYTFVS